MTIDPARARLEVVHHLDAEELRRVSLLVEHAVEVDGVRPLSEHVSLHLRYGGDVGGRHLLAYVSGDAAAADRLVGYLHLDVTDVVEGSSAELVVDPDHRGLGVGMLLVRQALAEAPDGRLRVWAHGDLPAARTLAHRLGFDRARTLWLMRRSLALPLPQVTLPEGVSLRPYRPADAEAWLRLNAASFADHPEQGRWSAADLDRRTAEPWFDRHGFLLAVEEGRLLGFHWTKVHGRHGHGHDPIGEVYVIGVDPAQQGRGLGRALLVAGLQHLREQGLEEVMLYVDSDNTAAIRLYEALAFVHRETDVCYALAGPRA